MTTPTRFPSRVQAGDTVTFTQNPGDDYDPADSWVLTITMLPEGGGDAIDIADGSGTISITDNGDGLFLVDIHAADTDEWVPGLYRYQAYVTKAPDRHTVDWGTILVRPDFAQADSGTEARFWAEQALAHCEAAIMETLEYDGATSSYSRGDRSHDARDYEELIRMRDYLRAEVTRLRRADRRARGLKTRRVVKARFPA